MEKIRRAKAQLEVNLATAVKDNKNIIISLVVRAVGFGKWLSHHP